MTDSAANGARVEASHRDLSATENLATTGVSSTSTGSASSTLSYRDPSSSASTESFLSDTTCSDSISGDSSEDDFAARSLSDSSELEEVRETHSSNARGMVCGHNSNSYASCR